MPYTFYWPLAAMDLNRRLRDTCIAGLYLAACFNPALAYWLSLANEETDQTQTEETDLSPAVSPTVATTGLDFSALATDQPA